MKVATGLVRSRAGFKNPRDPRDPRDYPGDFWTGFLNFAFHFHKGKFSPSSAMGSLKQQIYEGMVITICHYVPDKFWQEFGELFLKIS